MSTITIRDRLTVDQYDRLVEVGILPTTNRFELIRGRIVEKATKGPAHRVTVQRTQRAIDQLLPGGWHTTKEDPVGLPTTVSEPEPDVSVVRGSIEDYANHHPSPADVALVVEVAESSLEYYRAKKRTIYAVDGIPVYWIVNLIDRQAEVYSEPDQAAGLYTRVTPYQGGQDVPIAIDGQVIGQIPLAELLP